MITTMVYLCANELFITVRASELLQSCKHLPEDFTPGYLLLSQKLNKLIDIPKLICLMLLNDMAVEINEGVSLRAMHPFLLITGEE